ncbi:DUF3040 domain-containing protein [Paeniglutamicibacter sp. NPDC091659]|uniref:DUF3040 domain-containing protein n=1 Tax=Paeniglutamicibacter sp. NPDC091659 TaxID=3364389 RepID=UPI003811C854
MPLSDYEQKVLRSLEKDLSTQFPLLEQKMKRSDARFSPRFIVGAGALCAVVALVFVIVGLYIGSVLLSILAFVAMGAGSYFASRASTLARLRRQVQHVQPPSA